MIKFSFIFGKLLILVKVRVNLVPIPGAPGARWENSLAGTHIGICLHLGPI